MPEWSGQPAYRQVADEIRERIADGRLAVGDKLPSMAGLMDEFDVSITVIRMALAELRAEGLIATHQGKGAFVRTAPSPGRREAAEGEFAQLKAKVHDLAQRVEALENRTRGRTRR